MKGFTAHSYRALALATVAFACSTPIAEAGVAAGTLITNIAHVRYELDGIVHAIDTNAVVTRVDEIVAFAISDADEISNVIGGESVLAFTVRNTGNGCEAIVLSVSASESATMDSTSIAVDANGDGVLQPETDLAYSGGVGPRLCANENIRVFVIVRAASLEGQGEITLTALGASAGDARGVILPHAGDNGGDVVSGGDARLTRSFTFLASEAMRVSLVISQTVLANPLSTRVVAGDVIAYTLHMTATGSGIFADAVLMDALPAGLAYVAGTLLIDGEPLSDSPDADIGDVADGMVTVRLPSTQAPFEHRVTFHASVRTSQSSNGVSP